MASGALIAALVGGGGALAFVMIKRRTATPPPGSGDPCAALKGVNDTAYQACQVANGLVNIITGILPNSEQENRDEMNRRDAINRKLNGAVAVPMSPRLGGNPQVFTLTGSVLKFTNGCVPFHGNAAGDGNYDSPAPGWEKCAPGTQDMVRWVYDDRDLLDKSEPAVATEELREQAWDAGTANGESPYEIHEAPIYVDRIMTGATEREAPDPATLGPFIPGGQGPWASANCRNGGCSPLGPFTLPIPPGSLGWYVAGVPIVCGKGLAPARVVSNGGWRDHRGNVIPPTQCVPADGSGGTIVPPPAVDAGTDESGHGVGAGGGGGGVDTGSGSKHVQTSYNGPSGTPPPGYHWVPATPAVAGHWERDRS